MSILPQPFVQTQFMFKSLRYRLLIWFVLSTLTISLLSFLLFQIHRSSKASNNVVLDNFHYLRYQILKDQNQIAGFLSTDIFAPKFYITGESNFLNEHYRLITNIDSCFISASSSKHRGYEDLPNALVEIRGTYTNYCMLLDSLVYSIYQRGFQDFGLEGKLTTYMYSLEKSEGVRADLITQLKLHEKEYMHRFEHIHVSGAEVTANNLLRSIASTNNIKQSERNELSDLVLGYIHTFKQIIELDHKLGFSRGNGLKQQLASTGNRLEEQLNASIISSNKRYQSQMSRLNIIFSLAMIGLVFISFLFSIYTSRHLVKHLHQLMRYIPNLAKNNFNQKVDTDLKHATNEIRQIYFEFQDMLKELRIREKQRDQALKYAKENQQRYRELSDLLPQSVYETDNIGNLTYVNKTWYGTFGYSESDFKKGINLMDILRSKGNSLLLGETKIENNEFKALRKDGSQFPATVYSDIIKKGIRVVGHRGIIIDSTLKQKYIESLKQETKRAVRSEKHKSSFLANMSHEIRTPMNSIIGFSNMLSSKEIPIEQKEDFIGHIQSSSEMLLNLVDDIIDIAKIEAGQLRIQTEDCSPKKVIKSLADNFVAYKERLEKTHLEIRTNLPKEDLDFITDKFRLKQILSNLISNAIKFTEEGYVQVGVRKKNERILEFFVEDTGIGMTTEDIRTIFERFKRSKLSEEKKISGTGLGLAISKNLVEMLDGNLWVDSKVNQGTKFTFELPYVRTARAVPPEPESINQQNYNWEDKTILVAEDDDKIFTYLEHVLNTTGVNIVRAKSGSEAVEAATFHALDVVLMDIQMPGLNGLKATAKIKVGQPTLPIIAQTAHAMEDDRAKCIAAGCDDYITKPYLSQDILPKIAQFISLQEKPGANTGIVSSNATKNDINLQHLSKNN